MMISSPSAGDPYAAAAALDRSLRSNNSDGDSDALASATETRTLSAGPDVVVSLSQGVPAPSTYDASGRMSRAPTLDDMGANGPRSLAHATESADGDDATDASASPDDAGADAPANAETADTA